MSKRKKEKSAAKQMSVHEMILLLHRQGKEIIHLAKRTEIALREDQLDEQNRILKECEQLRSEPEIWDNV